MLVLLLVLGSTPALYAQYNPTNPPEPQENFYYNITVTSSPANVAYTYGAGKYLEGTDRSISYSLRNSNYRFSHWTLNGEHYSDKTSFTYKVATADATFVAHFVYNPISPQEPIASDEYKLTLTSNNDAACSFNRASVTRVKYDNYVTLTAYVNQGYEFLGWYKGATFVSGNSSFNYLMPAENVTLMAKFRYNPFNPAEPEGDGSQSNVQITLTGDVNKDGVVDVLDIVAVVNYSLKDGDENLSTYDINNDGVVDILDIVKVVNLSLE